METIYNIFPFCDNQVIKKIGYISHQCNGNDDEKIQYLQEKVVEDFSNLSFINIPNTFLIKNKNGKNEVGINLESFNILIHNATITILFEEIFKKFKADKNPLFVMTMVVDGEIRIEGTELLKPEPIAPFTYSIKEKIPMHYFEEYMNEDGLHLDKLMNDDFFNAIRLLFSNEHYTSSLKLLMSAIDTVSFLEFGDISGNFKNWINLYCDFSQLNITSEELWEFRNSLLHMTNSYSRKVNQKKVSRLAFYVSSIDLVDRTSDGETKYFNLHSLIFAVSKGFENWGSSFITEKDKFEIFFKRYDLIISDSRYGHIEYNT